MDQLKSMKDILCAQVQAQMANIEKADAHELGAAVDMIKDLSETMYYCSVVKAMEEAEEQDKYRSRGNDVVYYTERYLPYADRDMREHYMERKYDDRRYTEDDRKYDDRRYTDRHMPYYDYNEPVARDLREGRSPRARRMYMEAKEQHQGKETQLKDLESYMSELSQDVTEMIADASPEEKTMLHKKLSALTNKIEMLISK